MANAPPKVLNLMETFDRNQEDYLSDDFNEANLRQQFINPFFKTLGWDMDNEQGYAEAYKDVIHEASLKIGAETKAPDYCFRIGGTPKFYLEAKKPSVNIKDDPAPAFQLRRYGWSKKLSLSILTDFEEFAVYDCRVRPSVSDKASTARITYLRYTDYAQQWDQIASIFSIDAIRKGSFDRFAESKKAKHGTTTVDGAFLQEIEKWRSELAKNLAIRNLHLSPHELNFAVQITIDRIIFLRMCEDRGVERYGQLRLLLDHPHIYAELCKLYEKADQRYNSGLFHFSREPDRGEEPDVLTQTLLIDDKTLRGIIKNLYYPDSPYEFSVLPAEILGQVYEQFLGKVIRLTTGHAAKIEEKPEVKKAGGVYYTPTYIVDYIVKHIVEKLLASKTPRQALKLAILDPACGSGSFLLGAYEFLLKWYLQAYIDDGPEKHKKELFQSSSGDWKLTTGERKRILVNNIYGVDIDPQAVEVTKLSLLLKVLEGESQETLNQQLLLFHERALPDLANNIKCGNSLIGPDFYEGQQLALFNEEEKYRINVFDWDEAFPNIMGVRGFDAVIGNPPYIRIGNIEKHLRPYLYEEYGVNHRFDIYVVFVQRALELLSSDGKLGFIIPNKFFTAEYGATLRGHLSSRRTVTRIVDFGDQQVFDGATTYTCLLFLERRAQTEMSYVVAEIQPGGMSFAETDALTVTTASLTAKPWSFQSPTASNLVRRLASLRSVGMYFDFDRGLETGADDVFLLNAVEDDGASENIFVSSKIEPMPFEIERGAVRRVVKGAVDIRRYFIEAKNRYVFFPYRHDDKGKPKAYTEAILRKHYPLAWDYLLRNRKTLRDRKGGRWFEYRRRNYDLCSTPRILVPSIGTRPCFAFDQTGSYHFVGSGGGGGGGYGLKLKPGALTSPFFLLAILNSRLIDWLAKLTNSRFGNDYYSYNRQYVEPLPICSIDLQTTGEQAQHDVLAGLGVQMLTLHEQIAEAKTPHEQTVLQAQISATDRQIDVIVYSLYGLTANEIEIVENTANERTKIQKNEE